MTSIFPSGFMQAPLTAVGLISDGVRLSTWSPRTPVSAWPAANMSAPEFGNTVTGLVLDDDVICTVIVDAGSALLPAIP